MPGHGDSGRCIIKVASDRFPHLPEAEFGAMQLARLAGVNIAACRLMPRTSISGVRSEEHTSELQSLMRSSYAVFCLQKNTHKPHISLQAPHPHHRRTTRDN